MIKLKNSAFLTTAIYLCVILIGMVSVYFLLVDFKSRMAEKNSAVRTLKDVQDQEVDGGNPSFMAPRAQDVTYDQGEE